MFSFLKYFNNNDKNNYEGLTDASLNINTITSDISGNINSAKKTADKAKDDSKKTSESINELAKEIFNKSTIILVILFLG